MFDIHCTFQSLDGGYGKLYSVSDDALDKYLHSLSFTVWNALLLPLEKDQNNWKLG